MFMGRGLKILGNPLPGELTLPIIWTSFFFLGILTVKAPVLVLPSSVIPFNQEGKKEGVWFPSSKTFFFNWFLTRLLFFKISQIGGWGLNFNPRGTPYFPGLINFLSLETFSNFLTQGWAFQLNSFSRETLGWKGNGVGAISILPGFFLPLSIGFFFLFNLFYSSKNLIFPTKGHQRLNPGPNSLVILGWIPFFFHLIL